MARDELTTAKINAAVKILEWSKDDIEPGVGGTPNQLHVALAEAFRSIYIIVTETVGPSVADNGAHPEPELEQEMA
jgi:hypothetical protein